jgi:hypothetical protein
LRKDIGRGVPLIECTLLHQITRMATVTLEHARNAKIRSTAAVEEKLLRIANVEKEIHSLLAN